MSCTSARQSSSTKAIPTGGARQSTAREIRSESTRERGSSSAYNGFADIRDGE